MRWSKAHVEMLAHLSASFAEVSLAAVVLPFLLDEFRPSLALLGVVMLATFSFFALISYDHAKR